MAKKIETYEVCIAQAGRRIDTVVETVTVANAKEYKALTDRIYAKNLARGITANKTYYGIRLVAQA